MTGFITVIRTIKDSLSFLGFNEDVLKQILKMYLVAPQARPDVDMKPYLDKNHLVHQIDFDERRKWLHSHFRHLMSNRPSNKLWKEVSRPQGRIFLVPIRKRVILKALASTGQNSSLWIPEVEFLQLLCSTFYRQALRSEA